MCDECPLEFRQLARRIGLYDARHQFNGGPLHIVLADENVETHHIQWCIDTQALDDEAAAIATAMLALSPPERHAVLKLASEGAELDLVNGTARFDVWWLEDDGARSPA